MPSVSRNGVAMINKVLQKHSAVLSPFFEKPSSRDRTTSLPGDDFNAHLPLIDDDYDRFSSEFPPSSSRISRK